MATSSHSPDVAPEWLGLSDEQATTTHRYQPHAARRPGHAETLTGAPGAGLHPDGPAVGHSHYQQVTPQTSATSRGPRGFLTSRGAFVVVLVVTSVACVVGFLMTSAAVIPASAGWALAISSLAAAVVIREQDKLMAVWQPPLVMALVVVVLGQITLLGTSLSLARELSMFFAAMASAAPAQVVAVVGAFLIVRWRFQVPPENPQSDRLRSSTT